VDRALRGPTDEDLQVLIGAACAGDENAFATLWRHFNPGVVRFLTSLAGPDDAADVASAVWLEVVRGLDRFSGNEAGFRAWLFSIARSRLIDLRRARGRRPQSAREPEDSDGGAVADADPAEVHEGRFGTDAAIELIGTLPPDQAEVLLLRVVADLDVATVAELVGKRPGTVRVLAHRGLRRLAARLEAEAATSEDVTR
jgi:RNA polymerase sigma-70 factor, ECF subfamily